MTVLVVIVLALAALAATPVGRAAVSEAGRVIERLFGLGPWPIYHGSLTIEPGGKRVERLMFWDGASPSRTVLIAENSEWRGGAWSPDRGAMVVSSGSRIYLADRSGLLSAIADLDRMLVMHVEWVGDRIAALVRDTDVVAPPGSPTSASVSAAADWLIYFDRHGVEVSRERLPDEALAARKPGLLGVWDVAELEPFRKISPDGRWLIPGDVDCRSIAAYDLAADRRVEIADGRTTQATVLGWLRGSVLVWAVCDEARGVLQIRAGAPDAKATDLGSIPRPDTSVGARISGPVVDEAHDRVLYATRDGDGWLVNAFTLDGHQVELARIGVQIRSPLGYLEPQGVSSDGRLLGFIAIDVANTGYAETLEPVARIGVVDLRTGDILWACEAQCAKMRLR